MKIARKHHFISQFYLRKWCSTDNKVIVWNGDKKFPARTEAIAFQKDFYKLTNLKPNQVQLLDKYLEDFGLKDTLTYKRSVVLILKAQNIFEVGFNSLELKGFEIDNLLMSIVKEFNTLILENRFSKEESLFSQSLNKVTSKNFNNINYIDYQYLIHFIVFQYMKTPKKINTLIEMANEDENFRKANFNKNEYKSFWLLLTQCQLERVYMNYFKQLLKVTIFINSTRINYITSDDPSFNQDINENEIFVQLPVSPTIMIQLSINNFNHIPKEALIEYYSDTSRQTNERVNPQLVSIENMSEEKVISLNQKIYDNRDRFIYAQDYSDIAFLS